MLAQLVGFDTYAHRAIGGTMAETPGIFHVREYFTTEQSNFSNMHALVLISKCNQKTSFAELFGN